MSYRSSPCVFLGYPESFRVYRYMDLHINKIYVCKHVKFDEQVFPFEHNTVPQSPPGELRPWA